MTLWRKKIKAVEKSKVVPNIAVLGHSYTAGSLMVTRLAVNFSQGKIYANALRRREVRLIALTSCCEARYSLLLQSVPNQVLPRGDKPYMWLCDECHSVKSKQILLSRQGYELEASKSFYLTTPENIVLEAFADWLATWVLGPSNDEFERIVTSLDAARELTTTVKMIADDFSP